ncbi:hypothetical protein FGB62_323g01 [Gracilaria domingensis]|nr:hypothetical protein FGB62_323g01 [Gracilaria domingensis]
MLETRAAVRQRRAIAHKAFHGPIHPVRKYLIEEFGSWNTVTAATLFIVLCMMLGALELPVLGCLAVLNRKGVRNILVPVLRTLSNLTEGQRSAMDIIERTKLTRDRFTIRIMQTPGIKSKRMAAAHILFSRAIACYDTNFWEPFILHKKVSVEDAIEKTPEELTRQYDYLCTLAQEVANEEEGINFWFKAARAAKLDPSILDIALRGLSEIVHADRLAGGCDHILREASWKSRGESRCPPRDYVNPDEDIPFFCLSYKHETGNEPLDADELLGALQKAADMALSLNGKRCFRIWIDQLVFGSTQAWVGIGLMPFLLFPSVFASKAEQNTSSSWICLGKICSQLIVGGDLETHPWESIACSNTLLESISAVAEIVSKQKQCNTTIRPNDLSFLQLWAKGVLYGVRDTSVFEGIREEIGLPWNLSEEKKMHYIALFSLKVNNNSVLMNYYNQRNQEMNRTSGWDIKHIFFEAQPKVTDFDTVKNITNALPVKGSSDTLLLVTQFSNVNMYIRLTVQHQSNGEIRVKSMCAISEEQAEALGVLRYGGVQTVELRRLR